MLITRCRMRRKGRRPAWFPCRSWFCRKSLSTGTGTPVRAAAVALLALALTACGSLPRDVPRIESQALRDTGDTWLGRLYNERKTAHEGSSGFYLLADGPEAFIARLVLAGMAERSIDAQYYLLHDDSTGLEFLGALLRAADRGVRVRLLVDDMDLAGKEVAAAALNAHPNMSVRVLNPFWRDTPRAFQYILRFGSVTRRMHNKSFTVDNQATVLGGRNIGDTYFDASADLAFDDIDVLGIGPIADEVSDSFDRYWNSELAYPASALTDIDITAVHLEQIRDRLKEYSQEQRHTPYAEKLRESSLTGEILAGSIPLVWGSAQLVADSPDKLTASRERTDYRLGPMLSPYISTIRNEVAIVSPYFVPGKKGVALLTDLRAKGVRVRVLTNALSSTDVPAVHAGYAKYRRTLLEAGVELYETKALSGPETSPTSTAGTTWSTASLHAKTFVFDRDTVFIGSMNLDPRSVVENTEIGVIIESPALARDMVDWFDQNATEVAFRLELEGEEGSRRRIVWHDTSGGKDVIYEVEPFTSFWMRMGVRLLRLLPFESQL